MSLSNLIFTNLVTNEEYGRKVIPYLKEDYFESYSDRIIYKTINSYVEKYNKFPKFFISFQICQFKKLKYI